MNSPALLNLKQKITLFVTLFFTALVAYRNGLEVVIPTDSFILLQTFKTEGIRGLLSNFHDVGLAPVSDTILFLLYKLYDTNPTPWIISSLFIHAINAFLVFHVSSRLYVLFSLNVSFTLSFSAALLFLLSPYQTEGTLWLPWTMKYLIAAAFVLLACNQMITYSPKKTNLHLVLLHLFFILAVFSFESPLSFPAVPVIFFLILWFIQGSGVRLKTILTCVLIPMAWMLVLYFVVCKLWFGEWMIHYGPETHLQFSISLVAGNIIKYLAKFFLFYRYLPESRYEFLHTVLHTDINNNVTMWILFSLITISAIFFFFRFFRKNKSHAALLLFLFFAFMILLIPVINLDTSFIGVVMSDRYGYLPSVFFYMFLPAMTYIFLKKIWMFVVSGYIVISWICLAQTIPLWNAASDYSKHLITNFKPYLLEQNIFVLNMPDNLNWILTYRNSFLIYADFLYGTAPKQLRVIAGFYMTTDKDSVKVSYNPLVPSEIFVESSTGKQAFLHRGRWAKSYEKENYSVAFNPNLSSYIIKFKDKIPADAVILYAAGDKWRKLKL